MNNQFKDRVSVVTGAGSGIGRALAVAFGKAGARVVVADINLEGAEKTAAEIGDRALPIEVDISNETMVDALVRRALETFGRIDVLCNNAGMADNLALPADTSIAEWKRVLDVDLTGTFLVTRAVLPHMLGQRVGSIVNIGSEASIRGGCAGAAYTAAKHGMMGLTRSVAWAYANDGIRCNAVLPGPTKTAMVTQATGIDQKGLKQLLPIISLQQHWATPEQMADVVLFVASDAASFMNGAIIAVDGGWSAG